MTRAWSLQMVALLVVTAAVAVPSVPVSAADFSAKISLPRPGDRQFVLDTADMITAEDEKRIREVCATLLTDKATPVVVVTIESMAKHASPGMRIETSRNTTDL